MIGGSLTQHTLTFIPPLNRSPPNVIKGYQCCDRCSVNIAIIHCPLCIINFCQLCGDKFHNVGKGRRRAALLYHKIKFEYIPIKENDLILLNNQNKSQSQISSAQQSPRNSPQPPPIPAKLFLNNLTTTIPINTENFNNSKTIIVPPSPSSMIAILKPSHQRNETNDNNLLLTRVDENSENQSNENSQHGKNSDNNNNNNSDNNSHNNNDKLHDDDSDSTSHSNSVPQSPDNNLRSILSQQPTQSDNEIERRSISNSNNNNNNNNPKLLYNNSQSDIETSPIFDRVQSSPAVLRARSSSTSISSIKNSSSSISLQRNNSVSISQSNNNNNLPFSFKRRGSEIVTSSNTNNNQNNQIKNNFMQSAHLLSTAASPLATLSQTQKMIGSNSRNMNEPSNSTFRLNGYQLSYGSTKPVINSTAAPQLTITIDPLNNLITIIAINGSLYHTRHFSSLSMVTHSIEDQCFFTIYYNDSKPTAKCLCVTASEAYMITELINSLIDQWNRAHQHDENNENNNTSDQINSSVLDLTDLNVNACLFAGKIEKKSQLRWKSRWIKISPFTLSFYKTSDMSRAPDRILHLHSVQVKTELTKDRERIIILEQNEGKKTEIRSINIAERDTIVSILTRATKRKNFIDNETQIIDNSQTTTTSSSSGISSTINNNEEIKSPINNNEIMPPSSSTTTLQHRLSLNEKTPPHIQITSSNLTNNNNYQNNSSSIPLSPSTGGQSIDTDNPHSPMTPFSANSRNNNNVDIVSPLSGPHHRSHHQHLKSLQKVSRRRSRRSLSRDFHALTVKEQLLLSSQIPSSSMISPSHASSLTSPSRSPSTAAFMEWNEISSDPRPFNKYSTTLAIGIYQLIASLHASIMHGSYLTQSLYVPRAVWFQLGVKIPAYNLKCDMFEAMNESIILSNPPSSASPSIQSLLECDESLITLRYSLESIQERLSQHLTYIPKVNDADRVEKTHSLASQKINANNNSNLSNNSNTNETGMKKSIKRLLERAAVSVNVTTTATKKLDEIELNKYITSIQLLLESALVYRQWHLLNDKLLYECNNGLNSINGKLKEAWHSLNQHLKIIDEFLLNVLISLILNDLQSMIQRFAKYQNRAFIANNSTNSSAAATALNKMVKANRGIQR